MPALYVDVGLNIMALGDVDRGPPAVPMITKGGPETIAQHLTDAATVTGHILYVAGGSHFGRW